MRKNIAFAVLLCLLAGLVGCGKKNEIDIVEVKYPESVEKNELMDIFEYSFDSTWSDYQNQVFNRIKKYDVVNKKLILEYWEMFGIAEAGFDQSSGVWVGLSENDFLENRSLDMSYGFYENGFEGLSSLPDLRVWTSPDGSKRVIRGLNREKGETMLLWQENDGASILLAEGLRLGDYDIQCAWSGDGKSLFVRSVPNSIFPEKDMIKTFGADDYDELIHGAYENILFDKIKYGELWRVEKTGNAFTSQCIYKAEEASTLKSAMLSSHDGKKVLLYMEDAHEAILNENGVKSRHTADYIEMDSNGAWKSYEILHFNSKVNYTDIVIDDNGVSAVTDDGKLVLWNPKTAEQISSSDIIEGAYDVCKKVEAEDLMFVAASTYVYRYYLDSDGIWKQNTLYISPQGSSILKIKYDKENHRLLLLYTIDDSVRNTQRFQVVCLQLF